MDDNIVLIKSLKLMLINSKAEDIIDYILEKARIVHVHIVCQDILQKEKMKFTYYMEHFLSFAENVDQQSVLYPVHWEAT